MADVGTSVDVNLTVHFRPVRKGDWISDTACYLLEEYGRLRRDEVQLDSLAGKAVGLIATVTDWGTHCSAEIVKVRVVDFHQMEWFKSAGPDVRKMADETLGHATSRPGSFVLASIIDLGKKRYFNCDSYSRNPDFCPE